MADYGPLYRPICLMYIALTQKVNTAVENEAECHNLNIPQIQHCTVNKEIGMQENLLVLCAFLTLLLGN